MPRTGWGARSPCRSRGTRHITSRDLVALQADLGGNPKMSFSTLTTARQRLRRALLVLSSLHGRRMPSRQSVAEPTDASNGLIQFTSSSEGMALWTTINPAGAAPTDSFAGQVAAEAATALCAMTGSTSRSQVLLRN